MKLLMPFICLFSVLLVYQSAGADVVTLVNGDHITGSVVKKEGDVLYFKTEYAGEISIAWPQVTGLVTDAPVVVQLLDETRLGGQLSTAGAGTVGITGSDVIDAGNVPLSRIALINPPPPATNRVKLKGRANVGLYLAKGNTDKEAYHGDIEAVARTEDNRFTAGAIYNNAFDDGVESENNATAYLKYDHFFSKKWYSYANTVLFKDDFADLNLRSSIGVGAGYQFYESDMTNLSLEGGLSYVNEDFEVAKDDSYPAARWALNFDHFLWPKKLQFFHIHEGLLGIEDTTDINITSRTGLRALLTENFTATAQVDFDWDNTPSPGNDRIDNRYLFNLGYGW